MSSPDTETRPEGKALRVLVVDDCPDSATMLALMLRLEGHEPRTACDAQEALAVAADFLPDVVLVDIGLPRTDGYELARQLRAREALQGMTLVAMTGYAGEEHRQRSREAGLAHHLVKPVEPKVLLSLLRQCAGRSR
jgi:two-component system CheB/CheR fusion protein